MITLCLLSRVFQYYLLREYGNNGRPRIELYSGIDYVSNHNNKMVFFLCKARINNNKKNNLQIFDINYFFCLILEIKVASIVKKLHDPRFLI